MSVQSIKREEISLKESKGIKQVSIAESGSFWCIGHTNGFALK